MVVNRLQNGLLNSRIALRASRLNCQMGTHTFFLEILIEREFYSENNNVSQVSPRIKKTLTFETNDEHQARSDQ
jgi:hypothetical protein